MDMFVCFLSPLPIHTLNVLGDQLVLWLYNMALKCWSRSWAPWTTHHINNLVVFSGIMFIKGIKITRLAWCSFGSSGGRSFKIPDEAHWRSTDSTNLPVIFINLQCGWMGFKYYGLFFLIIYYCPYSLHFNSWLMTTELINCYHTKRGYFVILNCGHISFISRSRKSPLLSMMVKIVSTHIAQHWRQYSLLAQLSSLRKTPF